jgi:hypothetical protein
MAEASAAGPQQAPVAATPPARLAALRAHGAATADPVGLRFAEALARRSAGHSGEAGRLLQARLDGALAALEARVAALSPAAPAAPRTPQPGPLHALVQQLAARHGTPPAPAPQAAAPRRTQAGGAPAAAAAPAARAELQALQFFRDTWTELKVTRQLNQSLAQPPQNAGPLNSHRLVLRALERLQALSPAYLQHFMAQVDALFWLTQANPHIAATPPAGAVADGERKADNKADHKAEKKRRPSRAKPAPG